VRILLSHRPSILEVASVAGFDLVLAGHIHGGQIIVPVPGSVRGVSLAAIASRYTHGWYRHGDCRMYLNRGAGLTFVPFRVNCPPEIAVFRLMPHTKT
jgi:predicted MPP superfamily phosphohydrolase